MKTYVAEVSPKGRLSPFPLDMLRYDSCFPQRGKDVIAISQSPQGQKVVDPIRVVTAFRNWTPERWGSFGWVLREGTT